ncbi:urease accessory protein UreE [Pleurocapsales cyanobacterium LEGE 10410]|nr:urease accessory protein UreE [Pleurocapsales cyanobacterium LEGE 10410]
MTEIAQVYLGNINHNSDLTELVNNCLEVTLNPSDRQKGRIHAHTDSGVAVGIIKSRDCALQSGDIFRTNSGKILLIQLQQQELLVLDLSLLEADVSPTKLVYLGHVLGNHHYPITLQDNKIYVKLVTDKATIEKLIHTLNIPGLQINYQKQTGDQQFNSLSHNH